jgi:radical SAM superfamily enzyme YgiQ (UPF0313 family)
MIEGMERSLREPGSVLLVSCYELGHQPMGLAWPLAFLERAGFRPAAVDTSVERLREEQIRSARFVAISAPMHTALRLGVQIALKVRSLNPTAAICFFGAYAQLNGQYLLDGAADYIIGGESEEPLTLLAAALDAGDEAGAARFRCARPHLARLDFPLPQRSALPGPARYAQLERDGRRRQAGYVEATRGCKHQCLHCPIPPVYGGRFFAVPASVVLQDVQRQVSDGARHITFGDPDFLNGPTHSLRITRTLHRQFPGVSFDFTAKVEHLVRYQGLLREFAECGCVFIVSAVESLSDEVLSNLEKGHTRSDVYRAVRAVREAGIVLRPSLLPFTPWTSLEDYRELLRFVETEELIGCVDPVQYTLRLLLPPGSLLLSREAIRPHLRRLAPENFSWEWIHPDPRVDALQESVSELVRKSVADNVPVEAVFVRLKALAEAAIGSESLSEPAAPPPPIRSEWRLTEPWFC